jgi:hypothetical protein
VELHDVYLNLYLLTDELVRSRNFNITNEQYSLLEQGYKCKVEFKVDDILRAGNINIRLNDRTSRLSDAEVGWNSVAFDKDDVINGENEISFSGTGGFRISDASVWIGI